ncbi:MAG: zinc ribbon domain-containing protein [Atopobiaceae bacterium]|nr:zinc ribbon domain-containing protein [Atopobiaceae bacterium]
MNCGSKVGVESSIQAVPMASFCGNCGHAIKAGQAFCGMCGARL